MDLCSSAILAGSGQYQNKAFDHSAKGRLVLSVAVVSSFLKGKSGLGKNRRLLLGFQRPNKSKNYS